MEAGRKGERAKKREAKTQEREDGGRERKTEEKNSLADTVFFFFLAQPLFPWKPYYIGGDGREDVQKKEGKTYNRFTGEAVSRVGGRNVSVHFSPFVRCQAELAASPHTEVKHAGVVSIRDDASMGLTAACQYPQRMVPLTPDNLCQLQ